MVNNETRSYLLKMFTTWDIVDDWMARVETPAARQASPEDDHREFIQDTVCNDCMRFPTAKTFTRSLASSKKDSTCIAD